MRTEKLYDLDAYATAFTACVLSVEKENDRYAVTLDRTLFFPEEGGQECDTGTLGGVHVLHVRLEADGTITHLLPAPLTVGATVEGEIDFPTRFRKMQHHTGEHILSGLAHSLYGAENVGFHLGADNVTMDLSIPLDRYALDKIEDLANEAVSKDLPVTARYLTPEEIKTAAYRSKLDLKENVRVVTVEGIDDCACCAPHVARTGEIGLVKILDYMSYKGGTRLTIICGRDALLDYRARYRDILSLSNLLSAKQTEIVKAVEQLKDALVKEKRAQNELRKAILDGEILRLGDTVTDGDRVVFCPLLDTRELRTLVNVGVTRCTGIFIALSGSDSDGYAYIAGSKTVDLRLKAKELNEALSGRGGGSPEMIQGSVKATEKEIRRFFE